MVEKIEEEMAEIVEKAYHNGKVPIECVKEVEVSEDMVMKTVVFHET